MAVNGKQKGAGFEREICVALSKWITNGEKIDCLWRSAMSGGRATIKRGEVRQAGDITAVSPEGHALTDRFFIECKSYKNLSLDALIKEKGTLVDFWNVATREAKSHNKLPLLIFKQNRWPVIVCTSSVGASVLGLNKRFGRGSPIFLQAFDMRFAKFDDMIKMPFELK